MKLQAVAQPFLRFTLGRRDFREIVIADLAVSASRARPAKAAELPEQAALTILQGGQAAPALYRLRP